MKASVVIPSYNSLDNLKITLRSLEEQITNPENFEVIVIDDGSKDGTADFLQNYKGKINIKPVINPANTGRAKSRNIGIRNANNELIIFLDSDIEVTPDFIGLHISQNKINGTASVGKVVFHPSIKKNKFMKYLDTRGAAKLKDGEQIPGQYFRTTNAAVPRDILVKIGCFDEGFTHYGGEDAEIGMRISRETKIIYLPDAIGFNHHVRTLDETLEILDEYGEYSIPLLIRKEPQLALDLKIKEGIEELFYKFICFFPFYIFFKLIAKSNITPMFFYSYLLMRSYRKGYSKHLMKENK